MRRYDFLAERRPEKHNEERGDMTSALFHASHTIDRKELQKDK